MVRRSQRLPEQRQLSALENLPNEILLEISRYLPVSSLVALSGTSRPLHDFSDDVLYSRVSFSDWALWNWKGLLVTLIENPEKARLIKDITVVNQDRQTETRFMTNTEYCKRKAFLCSVDERFRKQYLENTALRSLLDTYQTADHLSGWKSQYQSDCPMPFVAAILSVCPSLERVSISSFRHRMEPEEYPWSWQSQVGVSCRCRHKNPITGVLSSYPITENLRYLQIHGLVTKVGQHHPPIYVGPRMDKISLRSISLDSDRKRTSSSKYMLFWDDEMPSDQRPSLRHLELLSHCVLTKNLSQFLSHPMASCLQTLKFKDVNSFAPMESWPQLLASILEKLPRLQKLSIPDLRAQPKSPKESHEWLAATPQLKTLELDSPPPNGEYKASSWTNLFSNLPPQLENLTLSHYHANDLKEYIVRPNFQNCLDVIVEKRPSSHLFTLNFEDVLVYRPDRILPPPFLRHPPRPHPFLPPRTISWSDHRNPALVALERVASSVSERHGTEFKVCLTALEGRERHHMILEKGAWVKLRTTKVEQRILSMWSGS